MYREKAKELLNRLLDTNYVKGPHFPIDIYTQTLIDCIANECKSTVVPPEGNAHRYESSFTLDTVKKLIGVFITNSCTVPKSIMNNSIYERGGFAGLDADVNIYKGIDSETGKFEAYLSRAYIDERDYGIPREVIEEMYKKYAREIVLEDARKKDRTVPKFSGFQLFMERMTHMPFTRQHFVNEYMKLFKGSFE